MPPSGTPAIQSSGVAERTALCGTTQLLRQPTQVCTDYASIVAAVKAPRRPATAIAALRHGGLQRFFDHHPNRRLVEDMLKVKAHVDISAVASDETLRRHAVSKAAADAAAKTAATGHPAWDPDALRQLAADIENAVHTLRVAAHVLPLWRATRAVGYQRHPTTHAVLPLAQRPARPPVSHNRQAAPDATTWQCQNCFAASRLGQAHRARWHSRCLGFKSAFRTLLAQAQGHTLVVGSCGVLPIACCPSPPLTRAS